MANTTLGFPYPAATDPPAGHTQIQALAAAVDLQPGIGSFTQAQITAFTAGEKRAGRIVWNSTTGTLQRCDGSVFVDVVLLSGAQTLANKTLTSPTIADLTNAGHNHSNAAGGGNIPESSVTNLVTDLAAKADNAPVINAQSGTTYTLATTDLGKTVTCSNASPVTVTLSTALSGLATGAVLNIVNVGAGLVTITPSGTTIAGSPLTLAQNKGASLLKTGTNAYVMLPFSGGGSAVYSSSTGSPTITSDATYTYYKFTGNGSITLSAAGPADVLVVAAGGGSGFNTPGAGGGVEEKTLQLAATTYTITVGASSAGVSIGGTSSFGSLVSCKGGQTLPAATGVGGPGLGGIAAGNTGTGGGGSGGSASGATGGVGTTSTLSGASVTYAKGGTYNGNAAGVANTGDGASSAPATDLTGGSGVVIVRIAK